MEVEATCHADFFHPWRLQRLGPYDGAKSQLRLLLGSMEPSTLLDIQKELREKIDCLSLDALVSLGDAPAPNTHFEEEFEIPTNPPAPEVGLDDCRGSRKQKARNKVKKPSKAVVSGKTAATATSKSVCDHSIKDFLPISSIVAYCIAMRGASTDDLRTLEASIVRNLKRLEPEQCGKNGAHAMEKDIMDWFAAAAQLQSKLKLEDLLLGIPPAHFDGAISLAHFSLTFFDRRLLRIWKEEAKRDPATGDVAWPDGKVPEPLFEIENRPGTVYVGNMTAAVHQVVHQKTARKSEVLSHRGEGFGVTAQIRTTLFPFGAFARGKWVRGAPVEAWQAITNSMLSWLSRGAFRLPTHREFVEAWALHRQALTEVQVERAVKRSRKSLSV